MSKVLTFPYIPRPYQNPLNGRKSEIFRPIIPIRLSCKKQFLKPQIDVLVDSGCDRSLFPGFLLTEGMNIDITKGARGGNQKGIADQPIKTYEHNVTVYIKGQPYKTSIAFADHYNLTPLLGRYSLFRLFKEVRFNEKKKETILITN